MKKLLSILGSFGMVATASTSVIACDTSQYALPNNPSNQEELLALLESNKGMHKVWH